MSACILRVCVYIAYIQYCRLIGPVLCILMCLASRTYKVGWVNGYKSGVSATGRVACRVEQYRLDNGAHLHDPTLLLSPNLRPFFCKKKLKTAVIVPAVLRCEVSSYSSISPCISIIKNSLSISPFSVI